MTEGVFLYYLPGKTFDKLTVNDLAENRLIAGQFFEAIHSPQVFKERVIGGNVLNCGPDNGSGAIVAMQPQVDAGQQPRYQRELQTWAKFGDLHIGYQTDMLPGPESLRRASQITGYEVELGDGRIWNAPTIRRYSEAQSGWQSQLPMMWGLDADMKPSMQPMKKFADAWETSGKILSALFFDDKPALMVDCFEWAVKSLQLNYRVSAIEAAILQLFNDDTILKTLQAAVDAELVIAKIEGKAGNPT